MCFQCLFGIQRMRRAIELLRKLWGPLVHAGIKATAHEGCWELRWNQSTFSLCSYKNHCLFMVQSFTYNCSGKHVACRRDAALGCVVVCSSFFAFCVWVTQNRGGAGNSPKWVISSLGKVCLLSYLAVLALCMHLFSLLCGKSLQFKVQLSVCHILNVVTYFLP